MKRTNEKDFHRKPYKEILTVILNKFGDTNNWRKHIAIITPVDKLTEKLRGK